MLCTFVLHCIKMISFMSYVACRGKLGWSYKDLVGRSERKRPPGRT